MQQGTGVNLQPSQRHPGLLPPRNLLGHSNRFLNRSSLPSGQQQNYVQGRKGGGAAHGAALRSSARWAPPCQHCPAPSWLQECRTWKQHLHQLQQR